MKKQKIIKSIIIIAYIVNFIILLCVFLHFFLDKSTTKEYTIGLWLLIINLIEIIYLITKLRKQTKKKNLIITSSVFIIQVIIMFIIPAYCDYHQLIPGIATVMPSYYNGYGF